MTSIHKFTVPLLYAGVFFVDKLLLIAKLFNVTVTDLLEDTDAVQKA